MRFGKFTLSITRFTLFFLLPNILFWVLGVLIPSATLINVFTCVLMSVSIGVCTAFLPVVFELFFTDRPINRDYYTAIGIVCSWYGLTGRSVFSIWWRQHGMQSSDANNLFIAYFIYVGIFSGFMHLVAPRAIMHSIPSVRWIYTGVGVGLAVLSVILSVFFMNAGSEFAQ